MGETDRHIPESQTIPRKTMLIWSAGLVATAAGVLKREKHMPTPEVINLEGPIHLNSSELFVLPVPHKKGVWDSASTNLKALINQYNELIVEYFPPEWENQDYPLTQYALSRYKDD